MKRLVKTINKSYKRLKYLDRTKARFFMVTITISLFTLYIGGTYAYFNLTKYLNSALITIADLNYTLSSESDRFNISDTSININANETLEVELVLKSLNAQTTKYALSYLEDNPNVKVYYSEEYKNNMSGEIGTTNSEISLHIILVNSGNEDAKVPLKPKGGYLQNTLSTNITEGYFPTNTDIVIRSYTYDENFENVFIQSSPPTKESGYTFVKADCSSDVSASWDDVNWKLGLDNISKKTTCDVYFKKMTNDIEIVSLVTNTDGSKNYVKTVPNDGTYTFTKASCNNGSPASWDNTNWKLNIEDISKKTICIVEFTHN